MSYVIEQKIGNGVYLYEVQAYWDSEKGQSRQKRRYLGVKDPKTGLPKTPRKGVMPKAALNFGELWLLRKLADRIGLRQVLEKAFEDETSKILDLACYDALETKGFHLYAEWAENSDVLNRDLRTSQDISRFMKGLDERDIRSFGNFWLRRHGKRKAIAFDITSISSHSDGISDVEWGYNRDREALPQINLGLAVNCESALPVSYRTYPGSIPDVKVLKRLIDDFSSQCKVSEMILDRGFYSESNLKALRGNGVDILITVPFNTGHAKKMLKIRKLESAENVVMFNGRTLFHSARKINAGGGRCEAHLFFDEERKAGELERFFKKVAGVESQFNGGDSENAGEVKRAIEDFASGMSGFFEISVNAGRIALSRKVERMNERISRMGKMLLLSTSLNRTAEDVLESYYRRDFAEKYFDALKNKMGNDKLRTSTDKTSCGRMFIAMIGLILHSALHAAWNKSEIKNKFSMTKVIAAMKPLKSVERSDGTRVLTEISKRQRDIIKALGLTPPVI